jgi:hypothetical protein
MGQWVDLEVNDGQFNMTIGGSCSNRFVVNGRCINATILIFTNAKKVIFGCVK